MSSLLNSFKGFAGPVKNGVRKQQDSRMRLEAFSGDSSGFAQWHDAMRMVARLAGGIPYEFRKRLWLTMANKHLQFRRVEWEKTKRFCFNEISNSEDDELGDQIVKDLHRTGCRLFCGADGEHNQALLKRVLLAYARWNKSVGYCQGFNMLAALILEVVEWKEEDALKVMIYLIEGVLPESYFANNLRGLSVDMAVFRDLLRIRLPLLSRHLDYLQMEARDSASGTVYEPPLTNVFTMQWFLTIFSNCLPKDSVLRVWDLMLLEGNEVLLRTALAIWDGLAYRIMTVKSADEFYSIMGVLTRETLEFGVMDANHLVKVICNLAPFPFPQLAELRAKYMYNMSPFSSAVGAAKKSFRLFSSGDEDEEDADQLAVAAWCFATVFPPQLSPVTNKGDCSRSPSPSSSNQSFSSTLIGNSLNVSSEGKAVVGEKERMSLDISSLKKQYAKLRERQKQAHVILKAATLGQHMGRESGGTTYKPPSIVMNHLLLGKKPLVSRKMGTSSSASQQSLNKQLIFKFKSSPVNKPEKYGSSRGLSKKPSEFNKHRRHSLPIICTGETLHWKDTKKSSKLTASNMTNIAERKSAGGKENLDDDDDSSSTELCDEDAGKISDFGSDLENDDQPLTTAAAAATGDTLQTITTTTKIPAVIISPEIPERKWDVTERSLEDASWKPPAEDEAKKSDDEDEDYSEGKLEEWLAKLEMYRKTLGDFDDESPTHSETSVLSVQSENNAICKSENLIKSTWSSSSSSEDEDNYMLDATSGGNVDTLDDCRFSSSHPSLPKNHKSAFNPFPVNRKAPLSQVGVKLGMYENNTPCKKMGSTHLIARINDNQNPH